MKKLVLIFFAVSGFVFCSAAERHVYRDSSGRVSVSATQQNGRTVYRDSSGRITVTATLNMPHMPTIMPTLPS